MVLAGLCFALFSPMHYHNPVCPSGCPHWLRSALGEQDTCVCTRRTTASWSCRPEVSSREEEER
jgi:hypothetical protein